MDISGREGHPGVGSLKAASLGLKLPPTRVGLEFRTIQHARSIAQMASQPATQMPGISMPQLQPNPYVSTQRVIQNRRQQRGPGYPPQHVQTAPPVERTLNNLHVPPQSPGPSNRPAQVGWTLFVSIWHWLASTYAQDEWASHYPRTASTVESCRLLHLRALQGGQ